MMEEMHDVDGETVETYEVIETEEADHVTGVEEAEVEGDCEDYATSDEVGFHHHHQLQLQQQQQQQQQQEQHLLDANQQSQQQQPKRIRRHQCQQCPSNFPRQTELNTHKWLVHGIFCSLLVEECPEPDCEFTCESKGLLLEHLYFVHGVDVKLVSAQLDSEAEFDVWLQQFQYEHASEFVLCTTQSNAKYRTRLYTCVFEAQPKRCDPHKSLRVKRQCAAHLLVKVPRVEGKGKVEVLGSSHHNHVTSPLPAPARDALDTDDESVVLLPQSASLIEMFQTAQQVIQLSDELRAELSQSSGEIGDGSPQQSAEHMAQVEMKILQLRQVLAAYDQPISTIGADGVEHSAVDGIAIVSADGVILEEPAEDVGVGRQLAAEDEATVVMEALTNSTEQQAQQQIIHHQRQGQQQHIEHQPELIDASQTSSDDGLQQSQQQQQPATKLTRSHTQQSQQQQQRILI